MSPQSYAPPLSTLSRLKDKVVLVAGAGGIGIALVDALRAHGATIIAADRRPATDVLESLNIPYIQYDATSYSSCVALFKQALAVYGHIDHAISTSGILKAQEDVVDCSLDLHAVETQPKDTDILDINLRGAMWFTRLAIAYLRVSPVASGSPDQMPLDRSITLIGSNMMMHHLGVQPMYQVSKSGTIQLVATTAGMLDKPLPTSSGNSTTLYQIRINCVLPGLTDTAMVQGFGDAFKQLGGSINSPDFVANAITALIADSTANGKLIIADGGEWTDLAANWLAAERELYGDTIFEAIQPNKRALAQLLTGGST